MQAGSFLHFSELVYAAILVCVLVCAWFYVRRKSKLEQVNPPSEREITPQAEPSLQVSELAVRTAEANGGGPWWNHQDFPYSAPWWVRYPASIAVFASSYWAFFEWNKKAAWILGVLLAIIGLGLIRELFLGALLAVLAGLALWALGAAVAALPVSVAIIIGAMIIAQALRR